MEKDIIKTDFCFKTTPLWKIIVLTIATLGVYELILIYSYWKTIATKTDYKLSPFWRTFFCNITNFFLFPQIKKYLNNHNEDSFPPIIFATLFFLTSITWQLTHPYWLISYLSIFIIITIQAKLNKLNEKYYPQAEKNTWTTANTVWSLLGYTFLLLYFLCA